MLKYRREGLAYEIWRQGTMSRAAVGKDFPSAVDKAIPELFEKQEGVKLNQLPEEMKRNIMKNIQSQLDRRFEPRQEVNSLDENENRFVHRIDVEEAPRF